MDRRDFLRSSALTVAALGTGSTAGKSFAAPFVLTRTRDVIVASPWTQSSGGYSDLAFGFARRLEQRFAGKIKCHMQTMPGSSIDVLNGGGADLHIGLEHENVGHNAAFGYFAGLPGHLGLDAQSMDDWLTKGGGQAHWDDCSARFGTKSLMMAHTGTSGGVWSRTDLQTLSGKKIAAAGIARDVFKGLGADVTGVDLNRAGNAISDGQIDAIEMSHMIEALQSGVADAAHFSIMPGLTQCGSTLSVSMKRDRWDALDTGSQAIIADEAAGYRRRASTQLRANERILRHVFAAARPVKFVPLSPALAIEVARVSEAVIADIASRDATSRRINRAYMPLLDPSYTA